MDAVAAMEARASAAEAAAAVAEKRVRERAPPRPAPVGASSASQADVTAWRERAERMAAEVSRLSSAVELLQLQALQRAEVAASGVSFAEHVLRKENRALREQVDALMAERKKFLQAVKRPKIVF